MQEAFHGFCKAKGIRQYKLILDVKTRWNSTHALLVRALKCRAAIDELAECQLMSRFNLSLTNAEWALLEQIAAVLNTFSHATHLMSSAENPTLPQTIPIYNWLIDEIEDYIAEGTAPDSCHDAMEAAKAKLIEYYKCQEQLSYICATG
jgi:hypothetical protein